MDISKMNVFKPLTDDPKSLPNYKGIYIITANSIECLPKLLRGATFQYIENRPIVYVGISNRGIKLRDYKNHFNGNARNSTLRKSFGVLMDLSKKYEVNSPRKYKFEKNDEECLSIWMRENLWLHYLKYDNPEVLEKQLINDLSPPLNIKDNHSEINQSIRKKLKDLRTQFEETNDYI